MTEGSFLSQSMHSTLPWASVKFGGTHLLFKWLSRANPQNSLYHLLFQLGKVWRIHPQTRGLLLARWELTRAWSNGWWAGVPLWLPNYQEKNLEFQSREKQMTPKWRKKAWKEDFNSGTADQLVCWVQRFLYYLQCFIILRFAFVYLLLFNLYCMIFICYEKICDLSQGWGSENVKCQLPWF